MNIQLYKTRLSKLCFMLANPDCWDALSFGVAATTEHFKVLRAISVDGVLDIGANRGQFSLACRLIMPGIPIVAFEPIPDEATIFRRVHGKIPDVTLVQSAIGETNGVATLHLSQSADSSSLLPIGKRQTQFNHNTAEVGTMDVSLQRLDDLAIYWHDKKRQLLKLDVQGYELSVLKGAQETIKHCAYVYAECSEVPLYDGQALRPEVEAFLGDHGFFLQSRHNEQWENGLLIQADYLFYRDKA